MKVFLTTSILLLVTGLVSSCTTTSTGTSTSGILSSSVASIPAVQARNAQIATEPAGSFYYGRRWYTDGTRYWGYLRRPGQTWLDAKLVIMDESSMKQPDRLPEVGNGPLHGYDHNYEYKIWGNFTGVLAYDPNSNFKVPKFRLTKYEVLNKRPGFLFYPGEPYDRRKLPPKHPPIPR